MGKSAPAPPPPPDYAGAAREQGAANLQAGQQTASLSNPNIYTPYGNQTVTYDRTGPDGNYQPTLTQTLTPNAQQTLDAQQRVQLGLANLGQQGLGVAQDVLGKPFQYTGPEINANAPPVGSADYGPSAGQYGMAQGFDPSRYGQATGVGAGPQAQQFDAARYGQAAGVGSGPAAQRALDMSGVAKMPVNAGMTGQQAILDRLNPQLEQNRKATEQRLANQGLAVGSEAWQNEMRQQGNQENDLYSQAALQGLNLDMAANQQGYGQQLGQAGLYNQALGQDFSQGLAAQQQRNAAIGQNYAQGLGANQASNSAIGQNFAQGLAANQASNAAIAQNAGLGLQGNQASNAAIAQNYGQGAQSAGLYNQAVNQQFNQGLQGQQFGNSAALQRYQQQLAQYNQPLNQITALMSGSQIQNPQFQQYTGANVQAAPIMQAAQNQGQYNQGIYEQQVAAQNSAMGGLGDVLGGAMGMFKFAPIALSDRRLKSNVVRIGTHPLGIGIYEYDILGTHQVGVMADEVEQVMPAAVLVHPSGFKMVNYGALANG